MVLTVAPLYPRLPVLSTQSADLPLSELSHQAYRDSDWYGKIVFFFLDGPTSLDDLSLTEKRLLNELTSSTGLQTCTSFTLREVGKLQNEKTSKILYRRIKHYTYRHSL